MDLVTVGNATLDKPAADAYALALAAGAPPGVTSSYRDPAVQEQLYQGWVNHLAGYNPALPPAESQHCLGLALDLPLDAELWFRAHPEYGFVFVTGPGQDEHWHCQFVIGTILPSPPIETSEDMIELIRVLYGTYLGRVPANSELLSWSDMTSGQSTQAAHAHFMQAEAEAGTVVQAFRTFLHRDPAQTEIDAWLSTRPIIDTVWNGVRNSPEAKAL